MKLLRKVISGGQTGIDELALYLAHQFGIPTGGWMPPGFLTEEGPKPAFESRYGMTALESGLWAKRTRYNVRHSDATVIFGNIKSGGTVSTINFANKFKKPLCINPSGPELIAFVSLNQIGILNVAGNKASGLPAYYHELAKKSLTDLFSFET